MTPNGRPRRRLEASTPPTTLTECARRYHAVALALARSFGVPLTLDFIHEYHPAISTVYIEAGRAGVRLPASVPLPSLAPVPSGTPEAETASVSESIAELPVPNVTPKPEPDREPLPPGEASPNGTMPNQVGTLEADVPDFPPPPDPDPAPLTIPAGFPSAGVPICDLKPAVLRMLLSKVAALLHGEERDRWVALHAALQSERHKRLEAGRRRPAAELDPAGHVEVEEDGPGA